MRTFLVLFLLVPVAFVWAQGKKDKPKEQPKILLAQPFGLAPGKTTKVTLRGLKLDTAKEVKIDKGSVKLLKKGKVPVPQMMEANRVGDAQVEVEVNLPADAAGDSVTLAVLDSEGQSASHKMPIDRKALVAEKEPNDGFDKAQAIQLGDAVEGSIARAQDVDVYRLVAKANDKVVIDVLAARLGSALDSFVTVYDSEQQIVATCDDIEGSTDSRLELTLAKAGTYYVSVTDAHDLGGTLHPYRLSVRRK